MFLSNITFFYVDEDTLFVGIYLTGTNLSKIRFCFQNDRADVAIVIKLNKSYLVKLNNQKKTNFINTRIFENINWYNQIVIFQKIISEQFKIIFIIYMLILISFLFILQCVFSQYDWSQVKNMVDLYYLNGAYPGAVLRVANKTHNLYTYEVGFLTKDSHVPFSQQTIFDIASLSKVSATLSSIMKLYDQGRFQVTDPVIKFIPQYDNNNKSPTTIQNLLLHNAGLAPDHPDPVHSTKQQMINWIFNCKLQYPIGTKMVYSDLSFILLGIIVQRLSQMPLETYSKSMFQAMGLFNSSYLPPSTLYPTIAPTEFSSFRKKLIRGQVHDPTAYSFGGVAGHAGFFSTAQNLERYMQVHLNKGILPNGTQFYSQKTVSTFYTRVDGLPYQNRRALGWDTVPISQNPPCGHFFSLNSFGHTGYTGTMMWADRDKNLIVVLLTNRVHPTSLNGNIGSARPAIVDQIVKAYIKSDESTSQ